MTVRSKKSLKGGLRIAAAGVGVLAISAHAAMPTAPLGDAAREPAVVRTTAAGPPEHVREIRKALAGMVVSIDPATGELRAPTQQEHEALTGLAAARAVLAAPEPVDLPGGGSMVLTSPGNIDFLTAVRRTDGSVSFRCTHGIDSTSRTFAAEHREVQR